MSIVELFDAKQAQRNCSFSPPRRRKVSRRRCKFLLEPLEPRLLLTAEPLWFMPAAAMDVTLRLVEEAGVPTLQLVDNSHDDAVVESRALAETSEVVITGSEQDDTVRIDQMIYPDFDGASHVTYDGPIAVSDLELAAFEAPHQLRGQESAIQARVLDLLENTYADRGVAFTMKLPAAGSEYSTIYVGGDSSTFAEYGPFIGVSEQIDAGNRDHTDNAFVFSEEIETSARTAAEYGQELAGYVAHEAGHLLGLQHAHTVNASEDPLAEVGWKPYTHVEIAKDVRYDLLADEDGDGQIDGDLTIAGHEYKVHPKIVAAVRDYPAYYDAGSVGPDGFPDLIMGQSILHPEDTGTWATRILDTAWQAQSDASFNEAEKSQILAWSYGFLMHTASDPGSTPWSTTSPKACSRLSARSQVR